MKLEDLLKEIFNSVGITFESAAFNRWGIIDDKVLLIPLDLKNIAFESLDGSYHFQITDVSISRDNKPAIEIPWLCIEATCNSGNWTKVQLYADEESIEEGETEKQDLFARLEMIKAKIKPALDLVTVFVNFAHTIRELFS